MRLLPILLILIPSIAWADIKPARTRVNNRCTQYRMCNAETDTGICLGADGDEIVLHVGQTARYTFSSILSTATDYTCNILTNLQGFDVDNTSDQVNTASITDEIPMYTMKVLLRYLWITCPTIADNQITIDVIVCKVN